MMRKEKRTGGCLTVALTVIELTVLVYIGVCWASSYWSLDAQQYGDPPGPYVKAAWAVPVAAVIAAGIASIRRVWAVAIGQAVMAIVLYGIVSDAQSAAERVYEDSYRKACYAGLMCAGGLPPAG
ncbi:DUF6234 family protein [Streptomyces sp. NPDC049577]|uniref:DUF6234 family protein n=1 Tax=Streptomyces sp. NPDC049577 TaxID=3155153 RepID=UPI00343C4417